MPNNSSLLNYGDCIKVLDKALEDHRGVRVRFATHGSAWKFRTRAHSCRMLMRERNREVYEHGHMMYGRCIYDTLVLREPYHDDDGHYYMYIEKVEALITDDQIESLTEQIGRAEYEEELEAAAELADDAVQSFENLEEADGARDAG